MPFLLPFVALLSLLHGVDSATIVFAGDAMQHERQLQAAKKGGEYDFSKCFEGVRPLIENADYAIVNLETPLAGLPYSGYPCFCAPDSYLDALVDVGFDLFLGANNHALDKKEMGVVRTIDQFESRKIPYLGIYRSQTARDSIIPRIIDIKGFKVAFLNYTYGTNGFTKKTSQQIDYIDRSLMEEDIKLARKEGAELVAVCVHWGEEYNLLPNQSQKSLAKFLHEKGADMVIGSHPHVIQPMKLTKEGNSKPTLTVYSLGNFISAMRTPDTRGGAVVKVELKRDIMGRAYICKADYALVFVDPDGYKLYHPDDGRISSLNRHRASDFKRRAKAIFNNHNVNVAEIGE